MPEKDFQRCFQQWQEHRSRRAVPQGWLVYVLYVSFWLPVMSSSGKFWFCYMYVCVCMYTIYISNILVSEMSPKRKTCVSNWLDHCKCNLSQTIGIHIIILSVWVIWTVASDTVWCMYVIWDINLIEFIPLCPKKNIHNQY